MTGVSLPDVPASVAGRRAFSTNGVDFTVADLARRAGVGGREALPAAGSTTPAAVEERLRRARGLLRADQLEAWLASWEIHPDDFRAWAADEAHGTSTATGWCTFLCSGSLDALVTETATAAAAACALGEPPTDAASFDPDGWAARLVSAAATDEVLAAVVDAHRLDWTRLEAVSVRTGTRGVAEELRHQVVADGSDLEAAATAAGCEVRTETGVLATMQSPDLRAALSGARTGELVGPLRADDSWTLHEIRSRTEASVTDPATRARAEDAVRADLLARAVARHVVA